VRTIFSENITPHATGVQGWTAAAVAKVIQDGIEKDGLPICPPMPSGPNKAFNGITDSDALDIGNYITRLPPINNPIALICHDELVRDGGTTDAGRDGSDGAVPPEAGNDGTTPDATSDATPDATTDSTGDTGGGSDGTNDGATGDGATGDGATGDGATGDGATGDGATGDGASDANPG
jgi:hypothetical protein